MKRKILLSGALACTFPFFASERTENNIKDFPKLQELKKSEKWEDIIKIGQIALERQTTTIQEFMIRDALIYAYLMLEQYEKAAEMAEELIAFGKKTNEPIKTIRCLCKYSSTLLNISEKLPPDVFQMAANFAERALSCLDEEKIEDPHLKAMALFGLGAALCRNSKNHEKAISSLNQALKIFEAENCTKQCQKVLLFLEKEEIKQ